MSDFFREITYFIEDSLDFGIENYWLIALACGILTALYIFLYTVNNKKLGPYINDFLLYVFVVSLVFGLLWPLGLLWLLFKLFFMFLIPLFLVKCQQCNTFNNKRMTYCSNCGFLLASHDKEPKDNADENNKDNDTDLVWLWILIIGLFIIIFIIAANSNKAQTQYVNNNISVDFNQSGNNIKPEDYGYGYAIEVGSNQSENNIKQDANTSNIVSSYENNISSQHNNKIEVVPFVGKASFNFYGGMGTGNYIIIKENGDVEIGLCGINGCNAGYKGKYKKIMDGYTFTSTNVSLVKESGEVVKECNEYGVLPDGKYNCTQSLSFEYK